MFRLYIFVLSMNCVCAYQWAFKTQSQWLLPSMKLSQHPFRLAAAKRGTTNCKESTCGGCHLRLLDYKDQLNLKTSSVTAALMELAVDTRPVVDIIPSIKELNYRNKAQFAIQRDPNGKKVVGLYELSTNIVAANHICQIQHPLVNKVLQQFRTFLHHHDVSIYNETTRSGSLRHLVVRVAFETNEVMVCIVSATHSFTHLNAFTQSMRNISQVKSILLHYNPIPGDQVIQDTTILTEKTPLSSNNTEFNGLLTQQAQKAKLREKVPKTVPLGGRDYIMETIAGVKVRVSLNSFMQSNPLQTARLYEEVLKCIQDSHEHNNFSLPDTLLSTHSTTPNTATHHTTNTTTNTNANTTDYTNITTSPITPRVLWDLYCGVGTIGLYLAKTPFLSQVIGVECIESAVLDARENAQLNNITNIQFVQGLAEEVILLNHATSSVVNATNVYAKNPLPTLKTEDIVVLNPPRRGCHVSLLSALLQSKVKTIVYISCNPKTLARDLKVLTSPKHISPKINDTRQKGNAVGELKSLQETVYEIKRIQPVDMFPQTTHVETVVWLERKQ